jgi:hypothetical protein
MRTGRSCPGSDVVVVVVVVVAAAVTSDLAAGDGTVVTVMTATTIGTHH